MKPGDTLWDLAQRHGTTTQAILEVNGLSGTDLFPGAVLKLPGNSNASPETYTIQTGDTLYDIAIAFDMSVDELIAINEFEGAVIRPGQVLRVKASSAAPPPPLVVTVTPGDSLWAIAQRNGTTVEALMSANHLLAAKIKPGDTLTVPGRFAATSTADQGGTTPPTIKVKKGDTLYDIAQRYNTTVTALMSVNELSGQTIRVGQTLSIVGGSDLVRATPITSAPVTSSPMVWPLSGAITSRYGYRQLRIGGSNFHGGLDIDGVTGDPIVAATAGVVTFSGWRGGYGNLVIVTAGDSEYYYAHASELLVGAGQSVAAGQLIARVGSTGRSTGSHLHFEIRVNGATVDPLQVLEQYAGRP